MTRSLPRDSPVAKISAIRLNSGSMSLTCSTRWFPLRVSLELFRLSLNDLTPRMRERFCFLSEIVVEPWYPDRPPLRCLQWSPSPSIHTLGYSPLFEWGLDLLTCFKNRIEQKDGMSLLRLGYEKTDFHLTCHFFLNSLSLFLNVQIPNSEKLWDNKCLLF